MINEKDIYAHLKNGGDAQALYDAFLNELNAAQKRIDAEAEAEKAKVKEDETRAQARKAAVDALSTYFTLVFPKHLLEADVDFPALVNEALDTLEETLKLMENVTIRVNGKPFSIFDL